MLLRFDGDKLRAALAQLQFRCAVAFAAACAERQMPNYARYARRSGRGNPTALRDALNCLWNDIQGQPVPNGALPHYQAVCWALIEEQDDRDADWPYAEDAMAAVYYTIETRLNGVTKRAASAARRAYASLDEYVQELHPGLDESQIESDPLIQVELHRQGKDLAELAAVTQDAAHALSVISSIRKRAEVDAAIFFDTEAARKQLA